MTKKCQGVFKEFEESQGNTILSSHLRKISIFYMNFGHAVETGFSQLWYAGIRFSYAILEVNQNFQVFLMFLHLGSGHKNSSDPLGQIFDFCGKSSCLISKQNKTRPLCLAALSIRSKRDHPVLGNILWFLFLVNCSWYCIGCGKSKGALISYFKKICNQLGFKSF